MKTLIILICFSLTFLKAQDRILNSRGSYSKLLDSIVFEERNPNIGYQKIKTFYEYNSNYYVKSQTEYSWDTVLKKYNFSKRNFNYISENPYVYEVSNDSLGINTHTIRYLQIDSVFSLKKSSYLYKFENNYWSIFSKLDSFINPINNFVDSILYYDSDSIGKLKLFAWYKYEYNNNQLSLLYNGTIGFNGLWDYNSLFEHRYYDNAGLWTSVIMTNRKNRDTSYKVQFYYDSSNNLDSLKYIYIKFNNGIRYLDTGVYTNFKYDKNIEFKNVRFNYTHEYYGNPYVHMLLEEIEANTSGLFYSKRKFYYSDNKFNSINVTQNSEINIYPNPANNNLSIEIEKPIYFKLSDLLGREILTKEFQRTTNLDLSHIPIGLYIYQIFNQNNEPIQSNKLEIKH